MRKEEGGKRADASAAGLDDAPGGTYRGEREPGAAAAHTGEAVDAWRGTPGAPQPRVLVGGIGYPHLRDHSLGLVITERLRSVHWPDDLDVVVEDLSYSPIAVVQRLDADPPGRRFRRLVVVSAIARGGARWPGAITCYRWAGVLPPDGEIRRAMTEAVTGTVSLDNTLIVAKHFDALPDDVVVVEVEPAVHEFGDTLSTPLEVVMDELIERIVSLAVDDRSVSRLPRARLGGGVPLRSRGSP
jgi:hydrogenase maturation protease